MFADKSPVSCAHCKNEYFIEEERIGARVTRFTCPQCGTTWEVVKEKRKPVKPPPPPLPTSTGLDSPAARREAVAGQPGSSGMAAE